MRIQPIEPPHSVPLRLGIPGHGPAGRAAARNLTSQWGRVLS
jgi:hypothetical protein